MVICNRDWANLVIDNDTMNEFDTLVRQTYPLPQGSSGHTEVPGEGAWST